MCSSTPNTSEPNAKVNDKRSRSHAESIPSDVFSHNVSMFHSSALKGWNVPVINIKKKISHGRHILY